MKVGLSYSRCVRDIVDGQVDIDDVLVLITRTNFDPHDDEQWRGIWIGYGQQQSSERKSIMRAYTPRQQTMAGSDRESYGLT